MLQLRHSKLATSPQKRLPASSQTPSANWDLVDNLLVGPIKKEVEKEKLQVQLYYPLIQIFTLTSF